MQTFFRTDFTPSLKAGESESLYIPSHLHTRRIMAAVDMYNHYMPKVSVLDVGCGYGHLYPHVKATCSAYRGIDPSAPAIMNAANTYGPGLFEVGSVETLHVGMTSDIVFCVGVAALLKKSPEALGWLIEELAHVAKKAVIIEFQNSHKYSGAFTSFTPEEVSSACKRFFNNQTLSHLEGDSTFYVRLPLL